MKARAGDSAHRNRDTGKARTRRSRDESGNIIVLFAIFLPIFLLCCAIAIDVGYWWVNGKKAQIAADACALAAARELPQSMNRTECVFGSPTRDYVLTNIPQQVDPDKGAKHLGTAVISPYKGQSKYVEATVRVRVRTFFGPFVGLDWVDLTRRAVAEREEGEGNYAIYSHSPMCPEEPNPALQGESLIFNGENHLINGRVHSNGQFQINNGGATPFWALTGSNVFCGEKIDPPDSARFFGSSYATSTETLPRPVSEYDGTPPLEPLVYENWPEWWTPGQFGWTIGCTYSGEKIEIDDTTLKITGKPDFNLPLIAGRRTIPTGTYCATDLFKIGGNNLAGEFTALARKVEVGNGNNNRFKHAPGSPGELFLFAVPNTNFNVNDDGGPDGKGPLTCSNTEKMDINNGNNSEWEGKIFHPCGLVSMNGNSSSTVRGAIYGYQVKINGNGFNMIGEGGNDTDAALALVE